MEDKVALNKNSLAWFLGLTFGVAWVLFTLPLLFGRTESKLQQQVTVIAWMAAMWAPGAAALYVTHFIDWQPAVHSLGLKRLGEPKAYLWAWLLFPALSVATGILTWLFGLGELDLQFTDLQATLGQAGQTALSPWTTVILQSVMAILFAPLLYILFTLGEELGWRGYLLPKLLPLGQGRAIVISGIIWGVWHAPAILQGRTYPEHPVMGVFLMIVFAVLCGTILSWLYLRTKSPWAPALAHGSLNAVAGLPLMFFASGIDITFGGALSSVVAWLPMAVFVAWLDWSNRLPYREPEKLQPLQEAV